jgi:hypothetical protein
MYPLVLGQAEKHSMEAFKTPLMFKNLVAFGTFMGENTNYLQARRDRKVGID